MKGEQRLRVAFSHKLWPAFIEYARCWHPFGSFYFGTGIAREYLLDTSYPEVAILMPASVYQPRDPQSSPYYQCVEDHFERFEQVYEERFEKRYGFFRPYLMRVIYRYPWPRPGFVC